MLTSVDELTAVYELTTGDLASGGSLIAGNCGFFCTLNTDTHC
jgi:hypothetical protein